MNHQNNSLKQMLDQLVLTNDLALLAVFEDPSTWQSIDDKDKEVLALLFASQGNHQLQNDSSAAQISFEMASKIATESALVHFRIALAYAAHPENTHCLIKASEELAATVKLAPGFFEAWCVWGNINTSMARVTQQIHYCQIADEKYCQAQSLITSTIDPLIVAEFNWRWGLCWFVMGSLSGEACDLKSAYEKYKVAAAFNIQEADFYVDFGNLLQALAKLVCQEQFTVESLEMYHRAVELSPEHFAAWLNIGSASLTLFELNGQMEVFRFAQQGFENAARIDSFDFTLWFGWGRLLLLGGKVVRDLELIQASEGKFAQAHAFDFDTAKVLSHWAEAQVIIGCQTESLDLMKSAEDKLLRSIEITPEDPYIWGVLGCCYNELGRYFNDDTYFLKAIEIFQRGISLQHPDPKLWYGLATSYFALGDLRTDSTQIERSLSHFNQVAEFGIIHSPNFWNDWGVALMRLAELCEDRNSLDAAIDKFEQAIILATEISDDGEMDDTEILYNYGCALDFLGDFTDDPQHYEKAIQILHKVLKLSAEYTTAHYNLAIAYSHLGELVAEVEILNKANEHFEAFLQHDLEDEVAWNDWGVNHLQIAHLVSDPAVKEYSRKHFTMAEAKLLHSAALGNRFSYYNLACLYSMVHNYTASLHFLEKAANAKTLPSLEEMLHDDWLDAVRNTHDFEHFLAQLKRD